MEEEVRVTSNGFGIASFVLSLVGIFILLFSMFGMLFSIFALVIGVLSLIFSIIQFKKGKTGLAIAGLVISILVIFGGIFNIVAQFFVTNVVENLMNEGTADLENKAMELKNS